MKRKAASVTPSIGDKPIIGRGSSSQKPLNIQIMIGQWDRYLIGVPFTKTDLIKVDIPIRKRGYASIEIQSINTDKFRAYKFLYRFNILFKVFDPRLKSECIMRA